MNLRYHHNLSARAIIGFALPFLLAFAPTSSPAQVFDFSELTALGEAAVLGTNVGQPVPGFELLVMQHGNTLYHQTFGNWTQNRVARIDSSTKTLTGAVIMSVAESGAGGFSLDSRLGDFLTEYNRPALRNANIRQAFSHQSGMLGAAFNSDVLTNPDLTLREAARQIAEFPVPNNPPGSQFVYGGLSMHAAAAAAEVATGQSFVDLFTHRIANPLGLHDTRFAVASQTNPRIAGGMESTAIDASRFMDMLLNGGIDRVHGTRILNESTVQEMLRRQTNDQQTIGFSPQDNHAYGIGVWLDQFQSFGTQVDVLAGGAGGFHMWIDQSNGLVFTFSTDLTEFKNVEPLSAQMHRSILQTIAVPEPSTLGFLMIGLAVSALRRQRRA